MVFLMGSRRTNHSALYLIRNQQQITQEKQLKEKQEQDLKEN